MTQTLKCEADPTWRRCTANVCAKQRVCNKWKQFFIIFVEVNLIDKWARSWTLSFILSVGWLPFFQGFPRSFLTLHIHCCIASTIYVAVLRRWIIKSGSTSNMNVCFKLNPSGAHVSGYGKWRSRGTRATQFQGYSRVTLSPGDINLKTWSSRLGVGRGADNPEKTKC
jgi:hypothetical protein